MTKKSIPAARRRQILEWLEEQDAISIRELETTLGVSHMTVHRDLDVMVEQGLIDKVRGGAILHRNLGAMPQDERRCAMCSMRVNRRHEFLILPKGKDQLTACCPHCGIMLLADMVEVDSALARDYLFGRMVNVYQAHYLVGSDVHLCCEPTVLCFAKIADAEKFSFGFGGRVMDFSRVQTHLTSAHRHGHH